MNQITYNLMKQRSYHKSFTYDGEVDVQTPVKSKANDLLKDEKVATRLGLTEYGEVHQPRPRPHSGGAREYQVVFKEG